MKNLRKVVVPFKLVKRRLSTNVSSSFNNHAASSLDLDFVLNLLDSTNSGRAKNLSSSEIDLAHWSRMKFKVIEGNHSPKVEDDKISDDFPAYNSFFGTNSMKEPPTSTSISTFSRLQDLVDSLPNQIYDRHGNLTPLNTSRPPMSFFDMESPLTITNQPSKEQTLPILQRENFDWSNVTLTSILKKIVPEEVFSSSYSVSNNDVQVPQVNQNSEEEVVRTTLSTSISVSKVVQFSPFELRLLDSDQLHALAKHLHISTDQTDFKIEKEISAPYILKHQQQFVSSGKKNISKEKITWTAENEQLLIKLYDELRVEKQNIDSKLQAFLHLNKNSSLTSLKRSKGSCDRGLWAVLSDKFRTACKFHVSMTECRNKLIILKRLKQPQ